VNLKPLILLSLLSGCAEFPALEGTIDAAAMNAPYPQLIPLDPLLAQVGGLASATAASVGLGGRVAALAARAAALRGPVIEPATRARMRAGIASAALQ
jgi:hypothetical protein